jgi:N-acetyl-gamma-glutamyl-phosphate reductase
VLVAVLDNLGKGAAGQALQNLNAMFGFPETEGLTGPALVP